MSNDPSPLKYMGTQSQETMAVAAATADITARRTEHAADRTTGKLADELDQASSGVADAGSKVSDAANWVAGKAKETVYAAADQVRKQATNAVESYTRDDPIRAILLAAGTGALLMGIVAMMARSGARSVRRKVQG